MKTPNVVHTYILSRQNPVEPIGEEYLPFCELQTCAVMDGPTLSLLLVGNSVLQK